MYNNLPAKYKLGVWLHWLQAVFVLLLLSILSSDSCSQVEGRVPVEMKEVFGPEVLKHTLVLLTCGDYLAGQTEEVNSFYSIYFDHGPIFNYHTPIRNAVHTSLKVLGQFW